MLNGGYAAVISFPVWDKWDKPGQISDLGFLADPERYTFRDHFTDCDPRRPVTNSNQQRSVTMGKVNTLRAVAVGAGVAAAAWSIFHPWVLAVVAGCAVLTGAAVWALKRWSDGKVYYTATQPLQARAEQVRPAAGERPAIVIPAAIERNEP